MLTIFLISGAACLLMKGLRFCQVVVNQERDLVRAFRFLIKECAGSVTRRGVEEQDAHGASSLCWCLRLPGGRERVRVAVVVAALLFSVYLRGPRAGRNAGQGVDLQGGRPQGPPPLIHVLPRPYGIKLPLL